MFKKIKEFFKRLKLIEAYIKEMQRIEDSIKFRIRDLENIHGDILSLHKRLDEIDENIKKIMEKNKW